MVLLTDGDFTKVASGDAHTWGLNSLMFCVVQQTRAFETFTPHCRAGHGRYLPDDTVPFVSLSLSRDRGAGETIITG